MPEAERVSIRKALEELRDQPDALISIIVRQAEQLEQCMEVIGECRAEIQRLKTRVAELENQQRPPPPAAPFRRPEKDKAKNPKKPGREKGHEGDFRAAPESWDEEIEVPLTECPCCGEALERLRRCAQTILDLPPTRPYTTRLITWNGYCPGCRREVRSSHPRQVSAATGAASTHLGARALGVACALKHQVGLSMAKSALVLRELCGLPISAGGLAQVFARVARRLKPEYDQLRINLLQSPVIHTDETSWWMGGPKASLWVFCNRQNTFYQVVESRNRETFSEVIPQDWPGVLVSDCLSVYDGVTDLQQKCYSHHLKAISQATEAGSPNETGSFLSLCRHLLLQAMELKKRLPQLTKSQSAEKRRALKTAARALFIDPRSDPREERIRNRIFKQIDHLFTFLDHPDVDATNNLAERQLRPAVIARKISCGQRTRSGADAWEVLASLAASATQRAQSFIDLVASRLSLVPR